MFEFSKRSLGVLSKVDYRLQAVILEALSESSIDFGIPSTGGLRSAAMQQELFLAGKSKVDGHDKKSYHQSGKAIDVYAYVDGKASWDEEHLALIADTVKRVARRMNIDITWGGDWTTFIDMPHFQIN